MVIDRQEAHRLQKARRGQGTASRADAASDFKCFELGPNHPRRRGLDELAPEAIASVRLQDPQVHHHRGIGIQPAALRARPRHVQR